MLIPTRISEVPLNDIEAAVAFYGYARESGLRMAEVCEKLARRQSTREQADRLFAAIAARWPDSLDDDDD